MSACCCPAHTQLTLTQMQLPGWAFQPGPRGDSPRTGLSQVGGALGGGSNLSFTSVFLTSSAQTLETWQGVELLSSPPTPIRLLSLQEMASDELRELRNAMTQEAIREHQMAKTGGTTTDLLRCNKCKKKNCTYNQVGRSEEERGGVTSGREQRGAQGSAEKNRT